MLEKRAFLRAQLPQPLQHLYQPLQLFLEGATEDNDVVDVDKRRHPLQAIQYPLHQTLKASRSVTETKGHDVGVPPALPEGEGCLGLVFLSHLHLVVARLQVECGEPPSPQQRVQSVVDPGQGVRVLYSHVNQRPVVYAEPLCAVLLHD